MKKSMNIHVRHAEILFEHHAHASAVLLAMLADEVINEGKHGTGEERSRNLGSDNFKV